MESKFNVISGSQFLPSNCHWSSQSHDQEMIKFYLFLVNGTLILVKQDG